jgi:vacuolar protein sorting-associated protein 8
MAVTDNIVIGTSKGLILIFDHQENHKAIIGLGTKAVECGAVTTLAISADHTTVAAGHASGHIFTWEVTRPTRPFLHIPPIDFTKPQARKSDGHVGCAVLHVGFLGYRRTALVSADDRGMAFSHLATRGMGAVGRTVRTTRILGRYPDLVKRIAKPQKQSSVLAFSPLPLGNVEQGTDPLGLVAMMTPYLLVIVSTTPIAQTQHKTAKPKEVAAHSAMTAALAWFPAIKLKARDSATSKTKLVYCWSNILTVLEVYEDPSPDGSNKEKPPDLQFLARSRYRCEEAIVGVQWMSRSVLAVLTITQQLLIIEDVSMHLTDSFDLLPKNIYHTDLYSHQLQSLVEHLDEEDASMHGVVADAFHMSFRAYKGRLYLLGLNDIYWGNLTNWADRLLALLEVGDFIGAIRLATTYHVGAGEKVTIGLPEDDSARSAIVREKLLEMMVASLKYAFGRNQQASSRQIEKSQMTDLASACIAACISLNDHKFLFDEVYSWFDDHDQAVIFLDVLEPYISDGQVSSLPPVAVKALFDHFRISRSSSRLEEIICLLDTSTMDIDQVTTLCKKHNLYDAYIYVWTKALGDYTGPLEELLKLASDVSRMNGNAAQIQENAQKIFPYMSFILTSRTYPTAVPLDEDDAVQAKAQIYNFFFSGASNEHTSPFTHLREILSFDAASFFSVLNEAFEDNFLNTNADLAYNDTDSTVDANNPTSINRQLIVRILLEVMSTSDFGPEDSIYLDMFIARSLPKYPQYILLSGTALHEILVRLCQFPAKDMKEDAQLSVEYLMSVYRPPDILSLVPTLRHARFFRILKSVYKQEQQYADFIATYFIDQEDQEDIFPALLDCLRAESVLRTRQRLEVIEVLKVHAQDLVAIDVEKTAITVDRIAPELHHVLLEAQKDDLQGQYEYLHVLLEPDDQSGLRGRYENVLLERYVQLMCQYNPSHVADYVNGLKAGDLRLQEVLPAMELGNVVDAAVILLARQGSLKDAMDRLAKHLQSLKAILVELVRSAEHNPDEVTANEAITAVLESIDKYAGVGIWLCQRQTKSSQNSRPAARSPKRITATKQPLSFEEKLWLELINTVIVLAKDLAPKSRSGSEEDEIAFSLRRVIQRVFTALLTATSSSQEAVGDRYDFSFLRILRAFLTSAAKESPSLSELRSVIGSIFSAYAYEESLLALANSMLDKDLFVHVDDVAKMRQQGWRPRGQICEVCRRRVWGPGIGSITWEAWREKEQDRTRRRMLTDLTDQKSDIDGARGKGKAAAEVLNEPENEGPSGIAGAQEDLGPIVVFSCRHLYHQKCLGTGQVSDADGRNEPLHGDNVVTCPVCA